MVGEISPCRCVETAIHIARNFDDARRLMRMRAVSRALLHADFAKEEMSKLEECLGVDLAEARRSLETCLLYTSPSPRDRQKSRMPSSA